MIVRGLDTVGDWLFGKGIADYKASQDAIAQNIQTRLYMFLNDCFFATNAGLDWFTYLSSKNQLAVELAVASTILNTEGVLGLVQVSANLSTTRLISLNYTVTTIYSAQAGTLIDTSSFLLTEDGDLLTTEDGDDLEG